MHSSPKFGKLPSPMSSQLMSSQPPIILASSSPYRKALLSRLEIPFDTVSPNIDESPLPDESPESLAGRLSKEKTLAVGEHKSNHIIIASDQVASVQNTILNKPGNFENAHKQLRLCSGESVVFYTGLAVFNSQSNNLQLVIDRYDVKFRRLSTQAITRYLKKEQPFDCAGSFKMEGLGISLFEKMQGNDPNSLIGLPLIELVSLLDNEGIQVP